MAAGFISLKEAALSYAEAIRAFEQAGRTRRIFLAFVRNGFADRFPAYLRPETAEDLLALSRARRTMARCGLINAGFIEHAGQRLNFKRSFSS